MKNDFNNYKKSMIIASACTALLGLLLAITPGSFIKIITVFIALVMLIFGGFLMGTYFKSSKDERVVSFSLVISIILFAVGIFMIINQEALASFITTVLGIFIGIKALFKIQFAINLKHLSNKWKNDLIMGLLSLTLGVLIILNPFRSAFIFFRIIGIVLLVGSVTEIIETIFVVKNIKKEDDVKIAKFEEKSDTNEEQE